MRDLPPLLGVVPVDERDALALPEFAQRRQRIAHGARIPHCSGNRENSALEMFLGVAGIAGEDELQMYAGFHAQRLMSGGVPGRGQDHQGTVAE